jgi:hypothetical protein
MRCDWRVVEPSEDLSIINTGCRLTEGGILTEARAQKKTGKQTNIPEHQRLEFSSTSGMKRKQKKQDLAETTCNFEVPNSNTFKEAKTPDVMAVRGKQLYPRQLG